MTRSEKTASANLVVAPRRDLCLDFANTLFWRGSKHEESLHDFTELLRWCDTNHAVAGDESARAERWAQAHPADGARVFGDAIAIREVIYRIFFAMAEHKAPQEHDLVEINGALDSAPARRAIARTGKAFGWHIERNGVSAPGLLAPVLWSAADLMVSAEAERLRHCSNDKCLWLFLDDSKNGSRRWCSMQSCGNRAKAHRHYLKTKSE